MDIVLTTFCNSFAIAVNGGSCMAHDSRINGGGVTVKYYLLSFPILR